MSATDPQTTLRPLVLRPAAAADSADLFEWRNQPHVRAFSHNPQVIPWETHQAWFQAALQNPARILLIGEQDQAPVGVLRYDLTADTAVVSVYLTPGSAGRGLGAQLLRQGSQWLQAHHPAIVRIHADIQPANAASQKAFERAGYRRIQPPAGAPDATHATGCLLYEAVLA
ncbi:MAG: GNAT family N-acetyltransferase [Candidatus Melainabacteria bacterium]